MSAYEMTTAVAGAPLAPSVAPRAVRPASGEAPLSIRWRAMALLAVRMMFHDKLKMAGTLGLALFLWGRGKLRAGGHAQAVVVTSTAATLVVAGFVLPYVHDGDGQGTAPRPSVSRMAQATTQTVRPDSVSRIAPNARDLSAASTSPAATPAVPPGDHDRSLLPLSVPPLPDASLSPVPSVPDVPGVSDLPSVPGLPDLPATSTVPTTLPSLPKAPATPPAPADAPTPTALP